MFGINKFIGKMIEKEVDKRIGYRGPHEWAIESVRRALYDFDPLKEAKAHANSQIDGELGRAVADAAHKAVADELVKVLSGTEFFEAAAKKMNALRVKSN